MDTISIAIIISSVSSALIYAIKGTLKDIFSNTMYGIFCRGEQISKGDWVDIEKEDTSGVVVGQNMTNTKVDTGDGVKHILNKKVFISNVSMTYDKIKIKELMNNNKNDNWTVEAKKSLEESNDIFLIG